MNWEPIVWRVRNLPNLSTEMRQLGASRSMAVETRPFGGFLASSNGKPGARGFARFTADEQALEWSA
jgi:hypothetical protein